MEWLSGRLEPNRSGRRCRCTGHNWKLTGGTTLFHHLHNPHTLLRIGSNHPRDLVSAAVLTLESRRRNSHDRIPACSRGLSRILRWQPNLRRTDCRRSMVAMENRRRSSRDKLPACSRGFSRILHWQPNLRRTRSRWSTALGLVSAVALRSSGGAVTQVSSGGAVTRVSSGVAAWAWAGSQASACSSNRYSTPRKLFRSPIAHGQCQDSSRKPHCSFPENTTPTM